MQTSQLSSINLYQECLNSIWSAYSVYRYRRLAQLTRRLVP
jgi:hypothetical protein